MKFRKKTTYVVVAIVLLFIVGLAYEANAAEVSAGQATDGYTEYDGGGSVVFADRVGLTNWYAGFGWTDELRYDDVFVDQNMFGFIERRVRLPILSRCGLGIGPAFLQRKDYLIGSRLAFTLSATCRLAGKLHIGARHFSTAGTSDPNRGRDILLLTWRF